MISTSTNIFNMTALNGTNGFGYTSSKGAPDLKFFGDVNNDGKADIGARFIHLIDVSAKGLGYGTFGGANKGQKLFNATLSTDGTNGFLYGNGNEMVSFFSAGTHNLAKNDINGDGVDDLIFGYITEPDFSPSHNKGFCTIYYGKSQGFGSYVDMTLKDQSAGFQITKSGDSTTFGYTAQSIGDLNGDGINDIAVGDFLPADLTNGVAANNGVYVVFGSKLARPSIDVATLDGTNGFHIKGSKSFGDPGPAISGAGDFNGDGVDDLLVGAANKQYNGKTPGGGYVLYGKKSGNFAKEIDLDQITTEEGLSIVGQFGVNTINGQHVSMGGLAGSAGDINGDGYSDVWLSFMDEGFSDKSAAVIFGSSSPGSVFHTESINGQNGFSVYYPLKTGDLYIQGTLSSLSGIGDFNKDGYDDLAVGVNSNSTGQYYESFVVKGQPSGFTKTITLQASEQVLSLRADHEANQFLSPTSQVTALGDVNGDGINDIGVGLSFGDSAYIVYGSKTF